MQLKKSSWTTIQRCVKSQKNTDLKHWVFFPPRVKRSGLQADRSPPSSVVVKNEWHRSITAARCMHGLHGASSPYSITFTFTKVVKVQLLWRVKETRKKSLKDKIAKPTLKESVWEADIRWEDEIKKGFKEICVRHVHWIELTRFKCGSGRWMNWRVEWDRLEYRRASLRKAPCFTLHDTKRKEGDTED